MSEDALVVALPLDHPLAQRRTLALGMLAKEKFIFTARADAPAFSPWLMALCSRAGFEPGIALEADRSPSALNYVAAGFGVAIFPAQIGRLAMPSVRFVPLDRTTPKYQLCAAWRRDNRTPALERFLATARSVVAAGSPPPGSPAIPRAVQTRMTRKKSPLPGDTRLG